MIIGGLITSIDNKQENKVPGLGDLPVIGAAFRYRTQTREKRELLVILTPHIVRSQDEMQRILAEEARRMDWILGDVCRVHGPGGLEGILPQPPCSQDNANPLPLVCPTPADPNAPAPLIVPPMAPQYLPSSPTPPAPMPQSSRSIPSSPPGSPVLPATYQTTATVPDNKDKTKEKEKDKGKDSRPWVFQK